MVAEGDSVPAFAAAARGEGVGAEGVAADGGDGALGDDVGVVGAGEDGAGGVEVVGRRGTVEEGELEAVHSFLYGDRWLGILRHCRRSVVDGWSSKKRTGVFVTFVVPLVKALLIFPGKYKNYEEKFIFYVQ